MEKLSDILEKGAILQRDHKTYAIVPRLPAGILSTEILDKLSKITKEYNIPLIKVISGQRIALIGVEKENIEEIYEELGMNKGNAIGLCFHYVQACPGNDYCKFGLQDSLNFAVEIENRFYGIDFPAKVKFGVSGCPLCCSESFVRDIGLVGKKNGWTLAIGGNGGAKPRSGNIISKDLTNKEALNLTEKFLFYYKDNAKKKERTSRFIARLGINHITQHLFSDG